MTPQQQPLLVFNTSILTADGSYALRAITLEGARALASVAELDSAIGHESVAAILSELLGREVPVNRQQAEQQPGQHALVIKLRGRAPEGAILSREQIEEIGYDLKVLTRKPDPREQEQRNRRVKAAFDEALKRELARRYDAGERDTDDCMDHAVALSMDALEVAASAEAVAHLARVQVVDLDDYIFGSHQEALRAHLDFWADVDPAKRVKPDEGGRHARFVYLWTKADYIVHYRSEKTVAMQVLDGPPHSPIGEMTWSRRPWWSPENGFHK